MGLRWDYQSITQTVVANRVDEVVTQEREQISGITPGADLEGEGSWMVNMDLEVRHADATVQTLRSLLQVTPTTVREVGCPAMLTGMDRWSVMADDGIEH